MKTKMAFSAMVVLAIVGFCLADDNVSIVLEKGSVSKCDTAININSFKISMQFKNKGTTQKRILNIFDPIPIFFSIDIVNSKGIPIELPGAGKIDFGKSQTYQYLIVNPGDAYILSLDLSPFLKANNVVLEKGKYRLKITYHNQYGENCIKGNLSSNEIEFSIE